MGDLSAERRDDGGVSRGCDLRNRLAALPHCWWWRALLESEQGLLRLTSHA